MLTKLTISNFKLHENTELTTSGLTVLTGINGMGKSSIIQTLLLLRQSHMMNDLESGINLKGDLCDIGLSGELACQIFKGKNLHISLDFQNDESLSYDFEYPDDSTVTFLNGFENNISDKNTLSKYSLFNENFQYISAFRFGPQKNYGRDTSLVNVKKQISKVMGQCEYAVHFLYDHQRDIIPIPDLALNDSDEDAADLELLTQVEKWLQKISPNTKIKVDVVDEDLKLRYYFRREDNLGTEKMSALNVGFGITYVLPILISILSAQKDSIIIIENPEAHIHPRGQSVLMQLITKAVANGVQVIIETHSDHIINGALVALKSKLMTKNQLSVYYFERDENRHTATVDKLDISDDGRIRHSPKGFFDQIEIDLRKLVGLE